ncbi:hypothetical protein Gpo141_00001300 [Globisporangium polare]
MEHPADAITCVAAFEDRVFTGDASGAVRCYNATATDGSSRESEATREAGGAEAQAEATRAAGGAEAQAEAQALPLSKPLWEAHGVAQGAILSLCVAADPRATARTQGGAAARDNLLLVAGAASGELVFFRNDTEARCLQLESAVLRICAHGTEGGEFLAGDLLGALYGVNQYQVLWKERLADAHDAPRLNADESVGAFFYPPTAQPVFKAIASVVVKDVENTLSSYVLISTGRRQLLVAHGGKVFAHIPMRTPVSAIASFSVGGAEDEDVVLAAGEDGKVYRIMTAREPSFRFVVELWAEVAFPIAKLLNANGISTGDGGESGSFSWLCVGPNGLVALFRGKEKRREWNSSSNSSSSSSNSKSFFPVDAVVVDTSGSSSSASTQESPKRAVVVAFSDRIQLYPVDS